MKNILIILIFTFFSTIIFGQESVKNFYNKYQNLDNVTSVKVQGWMIKTVLSVTDDFNGDDLIKKVTKLRVLVIEDGTLVSKKDFNTLVLEAKTEAFEDLMTIREGMTNVRFMIKENDKKIQNLLVLISDNEEFVLISLECNLKWDDLKNIDFKNIEGGKYFEKLQLKKGTEPRA